MTFESRDDLGGSRSGIASTNPLHVFSSDPSTPADGLVDLPVSVLAGKFRDERDLCWIDVADA